MVATGRRSARAVSADQGPHRWRPVSSVTYDRSRRAAAAATGRPDPDRPRRGGRLRPGPGRLRGRRPGGGAGQPPFDGRGGVGGGGGPGRRGADRAPGRRVRPHRGGQRRRRLRDGVAPPHERHRGGRHRPTGWPGSSPVSSTPT